MTRVGSPLTTRVMRFFGWSRSPGSPARADSRGMTRFLRDHPVLSIFSAIYILAFAALAIGKGNAEFVMYTVVVVLAAALMVFLDAKVTRIPGWILWCLSAWGLAHMLGGNLPLTRSDGEPIVLYSLWLIPFNATEGYLKYDQVIHAFGFFTSTCVCAVLLGPMLRAVCIGGHGARCAERGGGVRGGADPPRHECRRVHQHGVGPGEQRRRRDGGRIADVVACEAASPGRVATPKCKNEAAWFPRRLR